MLCSAALVAHAGDARARVQLDVALTGPAPRGDGLGYFLPEVARVITDGLQRGGVVVAPGGEPIAATLEERPNDRVVVAARFRGHKVEVEGGVETIDALVSDLIARLLPLCGDSSAAVVAVNQARTNARPARPVPSIAPPTPATSTPAEPGATPVKPPPPVAASTVPASVTPMPTPTPTPTPAPTPVAIVPQPASTSSPPTLIVDPYGPDAKVADPSPVPLPDRSAGGPSFVRNRVVVHTIADPGPYLGAGSMATQALYASLQRRLHLSVVPMGVGMTTPMVAADEGVRAQARFVVMARIDSYAIFRSPTLAAPDATVARMRLEVAVVREGRLVMRRAVMAETPVDANASVAAGPGSDPRRAARTDPTFLAVGHALDGIAGELAVALAPPVGADGR